MLKILGIVLIFTASSYTGVFLSSLLSEKRERLILIKKLITEILSDLTFKKSETALLFQKLKNDKSYEKLHIFKSLNLSEKPIFIAFEDAVKSEMSLSAEEKSLLLSIAKIIGSTDSESQINLLNFELKNLENLIEKSAVDKEEKGKLFASSGVLLGMFFAILIL